MKNKNIGINARTSGRKPARGIAFTVDAILALLIIIAMIPVFSLLTSRDSTQQITVQYLHLQAEDTVDVLSKMEIKYVRNEPVIDDLFIRGVLTDADLNSTVLDVLGGLWASQDPSYLRDAEGITRELIGPLVPLALKWSFSIEGDVIYNSTAYNGSEIATASRKAASGFAKNQSSSGYSASAQLAKILGKEDSKYFFFGGFIGQGNVTATIRDIPFNATILGIYLEANAIDNFTMSINGDLCALLNITSTGGFAVNNWTITDPDCLDDVLAQSVNNFTFHFMNNSLGNAYFGGGYLKVVYSTDEFLPPPVFRYYFAGAEGGINIYDSFYVIGNISNMTIRLHLKTDLDTFLTIGNSTIWEIPEGNGTTYDIFLFNETILPQLNAFGLNYSSISSITVPLRLGHRAGNFSNGTGGVDAVLITTDSGDMVNECDIANGSLSTCGANGNLSRLVTAKAADKQFVDILLNGTTGNRISHLPYRINAPQPVAPDQALTSNINTLYSKIDALGSSSAAARCIACTIARARARLIPLSAQPETTALDALAPEAPYSTYSKIRAVLLMTDGAADRCEGTDDSVGDYNSNCGSDLSNKQAIDLACQTASISPYSKNGNNITIYAVGFGPDANMSLLSSIANCTGGKAFSASNYSELLQIYKDIATLITKTVTFVQQVVDIQGTNSTLYPDSYIEFEYDSAVPPVEYKEISVNVETEPFPACLGSFFVPQNVRVVDAKRTSYSGDYWTKATSINNSLTGWNYNEVYNLTLYNDPYFVNLGDPFHVYLPVELVEANGTNYIGNVLGNYTYSNPSCSSYDRVLYTMRLKASVAYSDVYPDAVGRNVTVYYDNNHDGIADGFTYVAVGLNLPTFDPTPVNVTDLSPGTNSVDAAFLQLLEQLNLVTTGASGASGSETNPIDLILTPDLTIQISLLSSVPYVWGPVDMTISLWV